MALIHEQIPKVMAAIGSIGKDRKNPQQGYFFRGIDDLYNACNSALHEHGIFCAPVVTDMVREERQAKNGGALLYTILTIRYTFYASDGSSVECVTIGEAMDSGDKSCNKAMSAAQKYAFFQIFAIPTEESKDTEDETHTPVAKKRETKAGKPTTTPNEPASVTLESAKAAFQQIDNIVHLGNHWKAHYKEYEASPNFQAIVAAKDARKAELTQSTGTDANGDA